MKIVIALCLCGLTTVVSAQTQKIFTGPEGLFRFKYSEILVDCIPMLTQDKAPSALDACVSQDPVCGVGGDAARTIACFGYPKTEFKEKPTFIAAMFFVAEIPVARTEKDCLRGSPNWLVSKTGRTTVNGVSFEVFRTEDNWLGGGQSVEIYRTFHGGRCYELGLQTVMGGGGYDPEVIQRFTPRDQKEIETRMKEPIRSFQFAK
jgi:hypothetical protein